jgi:tetrahydromethanopterin S-methyltransferase subunit C
MVRFLSGLAAVVFVVAGLAFSGKAAANISPKASVQRTLLLGLLAGREQLTETGWRYRNLALLFQGLALAAAIVWVLAAN